LRDALKAAGIKFDGADVTFAAEGHGGIN
jgi:hypothetical protein